MSNTLLTPTQVTREAARILHQKLNFIGSIDRQYDDSYAKQGAKIGDTLKVRLPNEYTVRTGVNMAAQSTSETSVDLVMSTVKGVDMNFTSVELALSLDDFSERIIKPAMTVLAANIEADALSMYKDVYNLYDGDTAAFGFASTANAREILTNNLAPLSPRTMIMPPVHATKFMIDTKSLYQDSEAISEQYREGKIGKTGGFEKIYENTLLVPHATGTSAKGDTTYDCNTSTGITSGSGTITVSAGSSTFLRGDIITIAGVNRVHPETKVSTGVAQQFVVTEDSGASATSIKVSPVPVTSGARQNVTIVSAGASKTVSKVGAGDSETLVQSLAFHKDAFAFVTADLPLPEGVDWAKRVVQDGISISLVRDFNISDRSFPCRLDVLYGYKAIRPQLAVRVHNDG